VVDGLLGELLVAHRQGGEELIAAVAQPAEAEALTGLDGHGVREVRGRPVVEAQGRGFDRGRQGALQGRRVDPLELGHAAQHAVAAATRPLLVAQGRVVGG
jgi:hypothetical protein